MPDQDNPGFFSLIRGLPCRPTGVQGIVKGAYKATNDVAASDNEQMAPDTIRLIFLLEGRVQQEYINRSGIIFAVLTFKNEGHLMRKRIYTYMALVMLPVIGCASAKTISPEDQRKQREASKKEARQQVEDAKTLQPPK